MASSVTDVQEETIDTAAANKNDVNIRCKVCPSLDQQCAVCSVQNSLNGLSCKIDELGERNSVAIEIFKTVGANVVQSPESASQLSSMANSFWEIESKVRVVVRDLGVYGQKMVSAAKEFDKYGDVKELLLETRSPSQDTLQYVSQCASALENLRSSERLEPIQDNSSTSTDRTRRRGPRSTIGYHNSGVSIGCWSILTAFFTQLVNDMKHPHVALRRVRETKGKERLSESESETREEPAPPNDVDILGQYIYCLRSIEKIILQLSRGSHLKESVKAEKKASKKQLSSQRIHECSEQIEASAKCLVKACADFLGKE